MLSLAISPCPNDTFAFYGLLHHKVAFEHQLQLRFADIEELNQLCFAAAVDICKISFHTWLEVREDYQLLNAGSALGFGCGPLLVARQAFEKQQLQDRTIAVPGVHTTALLLLKLYLAGLDCQLLSMPFDEIMPAVSEGRVDAGLIIHESRFTYARHGLLALIDLGSWWEQTSGHPIPLGGIVARRSLGQDLINAFDQALARSIDYAWANRQETVPFMQAHAQEMEAEVMAAHVELYVNEFTRNLGPAGYAALDDLAQRAALLKK